MKILIAGAGIAGLVLRARLQKSQHQHKITIIEKRKLSENKTDAGVGLGLPANAVMGLACMGLFPAIQKLGYPVHKFSARTYLNEILSEASPNIIDNYAPFYSLSRSHLYELLLSLSNIPIEHDLTIQDISKKPEGYLVKFHNGSSETYDLIIGADGMRSSLREMLYGCDTLNDIGVTNWRFNIKRPINLKFPIQMRGIKDVFAMFPTNQHEAYCYVHTNDTDKIFYRNKSFSLSKLSAIINTYKADHLGSISTLSLENINIASGRLYFCKSYYPGKEGIILIGDAGHACPPILQQGGALAIEDALILGYLINNPKNTLNPQEISHQFIQMRSDRILHILQQSKEAINFSLPSSKQYDAEFRYTKTNELIKKEGPLNIKGWKNILTHDPLKEIFKYKDFNDLINSIPHSGVSNDARTGNDGIWR